jgi:hypothetical protein
VRVRHLLGSLRAGPYPAPRFGEPLRVAQIGEAARFQDFALDHSLEEIDSIFCDRGARSDPAPRREALERFAPHVVLAFEPGLAAAAAVSGLNAATLAFVTGRLRASRAFDRLVAFDAGLDGAWRSRPLAVADRLFALPRLPGRDVAVNLEDGRDLGFERNVLLPLAAGKLLVSEPLVPSHGLEPDVDFVEISTRDHLARVLHALDAYPGAYERVRRRGRAKAELFRASVVYPMLVHDLYLDLAAFGTERRA